MYFLSRNGFADQVDSLRTDWKHTGRLGDHGADTDERAALLGSWHKEEWAERLQREHVRQAMRAMEEGGAAVLMERIPAGGWFSNSAGITWISFLSTRARRDRPDQGVHPDRVADGRHRARRGAGRGSTQAAAPTPRPHSWTRRWRCSRG